MLALEEWSVALISTPSAVGTAPRSPAPAEPVNVRLGGRLGLGVGVADGDGAGESLGLDDGLGLLDGPAEDGPGHPTPSLGTGEGLGFAPSGAAEGEGCADGAAEGTRGGLGLAADVAAP